MERPTDRRSARPRGVLVGDRQDHRRSPDHGVAASRALPVVGLILALAGCADQQQPTVVVVNSSDSGQTVLTTVLIGATLLGVAGVALFAALWSSERRGRQEAEHARRQAEDIVIAVSGMPVSQARAAMLGRIQAPEPRAGPALEPHPRRAIAG